MYFPTNDLKHCLLSLLKHQLAIKGLVSHTKTIIFLMTCNFKSTTSCLFSSAFLYYSTWLTGEGTVFVSTATGTEDILGLGGGIGLGGLLFLRQTLSWEEERNVVDSTTSSSVTEGGDGRLLLSYRSTWEMISCVCWCFKSSTDEAGGGGTTTGSCWHRVESTGGPAGDLFFRGGFLGLGTGRTEGAIPEDEEEDDDLRPLPLPVSSSTSNSSKDPSVDEYLSLYESATVTGGMIPILSCCESISEFVTKGLMSDFKSLGSITWVKGDAFVSSSGWQEWEGSGEDVTETPESTNGLVW